MNGLYIHIPFCARKCNYCDFVSFVCDDNIKDAYVSALAREAQIAQETLDLQTFDTVFIGGGTPSIMPDGAIAQITDVLYRAFDISLDAEFTIESNPGTLSANKLREYIDVGINRISIGLQSANDKILQALGRIHTFDEFVHGVELARSAGFANINADIMYGLPAQTLSDCTRTIDAVCDLKLEHISAYSLILEEHTALFEAVTSGKTLLPNDETAYQMHCDVHEQLKNAGYSRYEISNYAKAGFECKHNLNYWDCGEYLGLGVNAHSAMRKDDGLKRWNNYATLAEWFGALANGKAPCAQHINEKKPDEMFEFIMMGLRTIKGIRVSDFIDRFGVSPLDIYAAAIKTNSDIGWLFANNDKIMLTDSGLDVQNLVLMEFLPN